MQYAFFLSGENLELAKEEVLSITDFIDFNLVDKLLVIDAKNEFKKTKINELKRRLALAKSIYKVLFKSSIKNLIKNIKNYDWNSIYKNNFCVRAHYIGHMANYKKMNEKNIAGFIWNKLKNPKVALENTETKIEFFFFNNNAYCCLLIARIENNYDKRKAHKRPFPHPSSLHPRIARALVNLTGAKKGEDVVDPFCGSGGFLIEAGLMGIDAIGYDIDKKMIEGCKENLDFFKIKNYRLYNKDALQIKKADYIVTDFPYGLNSNLILCLNKKSVNNKINKTLQKISVKVDKQNKKILENFYFLFLKRLKKTLRKMAVVVFPSFVDYKRIIKKSGLKLKKEFSVYVHRSLTRKIAVLE